MSAIDGYLQSLRSASRDVHAHREAIAAMRAAHLHPSTGDVERVVVTRALALGGVSEVIRFLVDRRTRLQPPGVEALIKLQRHGAFLQAGLISSEDLDEVQRLLDSAIRHYETAPESGAQPSARGTV